jgi:predicted XRE-type DNA-binding protein
MSPRKAIPVTHSTGNVFSDLQVEGAEEALAKAELARMISTIITTQRLTQTEAARRLGIDQPKVSALTRGRLEGFSIDRLLRFLLALDRDIEIVVKPRSRGNAAGRVDVVSVR